MVAWGGDGSGKEPAAGADAIIGIGERESQARTTRDYAAQLLRRYGNGPTIRRVFLAGGAVGVSLVIALVLIGGLTFKREIEYVECERFAAPFATVHVQSSPKGSGWGNRALSRLRQLRAAVRFADVRDATRRRRRDVIPAERAGRRSRRRDGAQAAAGRRWRPYFFVRQDGVRRPARGFLYRQRAIIAVTLSRLRVTGTLTEIASTAGKPQHFTHVFEAHHASRLTLGRWSWAF